MAEKSISVLFCELRVLNREIDNSILSQYHLLFDEQYDIDIKEVKLYQQRLLAMLRKTNDLSATLSRYLSLIDCRVNCYDSYKQIQVDRKEFGNE